MIRSLKLACGAQSTSKMEGMLNDLLGQDKADREFKGWLRGGGAGAGSGASGAHRPLALDFGVQVLTSGWWPAAVPLVIALPPPMDACRRAYEAWYACEKGNRRLQWSCTLGTATVRAQYGPKTYELSLSTLQAIVLLLFADPSAPSAALTVEVIRARTGCDNAEVLKRILHSLSCGRFKLLTKTPESATIKSNHTFAYNPAFSCDMVRVRVPMPSLEETHNSKQLEDERSLTIEAAIVRIMKAHQTLSHGELVVKVMQQLQFFQPTAKAIKKCVEDLLERDYLARSPDDPNSYTYTA